jgi:polyketide synthase PksN
LIGQQSLLVLCAEDLLARGHAIRGVATESDEIRAWAAGRNVPVLPSTNDRLVELLSQEPCDYLLSIINYRVLPDHVLRLPKRGAINFHDGPLPGYAGMYVTTWALINREPEHGISWHLMTKEIDAGGVLQEKRFPVSADDTAFTLNTKCYDAGFEAFRELLADLERGTASSRVQAANGSHGYYGLRKRPAQMAMLDWSRSAEELGALHRSLDFGRYENPIGCAKMAWGDRILVPRRLTVLPRTSILPPGTLDRSAQTDAVCVHTSTKLIELAEFRTLDGEAVEISSLASVSPTMGPSQLPQANVPAELDQLLERVCVHESFWAARLAQRDPISLPYLPAEIRRDQPPAQRVRRDLAGSRLCPAGDSFEFFPRAIAAISLYLGRLSGKEAFDLDYQGLSLTGLPREAASYFSTCVPLRIRLTWSESFTEHVRQAEGAIRELEKRGTYARDLVLRYPQITDEHRQRLREIPDVAVAILPAGSDAAIDLPLAQLTFLISQSEPQIALFANADVIDEQLLAKIADELEHMLAQLGTNPQTALADVSLVTPSEQAALDRLNEETRLAYAPTSLPRRFEAQVARTPDATAVVFRDQSVSYRQLNLRANQLANLLIARGVKRGDLVGVLMDRSWEMVASLYAVLKAGAAYVPMDPAYPSHRLEIMVEDAGAAVILTQESRVAQLAAVNAEAIAVDRPSVLEGVSSSLPRIEFEPDDVAYVMYTSGSTGRPKGVMVTHRNINNFFANIDRVLAGDPPGTWLAVTSISFDISIPELFWTLTRGARVILRGSSEELDDIATLMERHRVTHFQCTPSRATSLTWDPETRKAMGNLKLMIVGGEAMSEELARQLRSIVPGRVFNVYGPTETTVWSTMQELKELSGPVPIGKPVANTQLYVMDERQQPLPLGVPGELLIGGDGVGRGYLKRPDLTQARFIQHNGGTVYRTGDLVRLRADGVVEFLGRFDHQVKIRGHRIELGEIEAVLELAPGVRQAVVHPQDDAAGGKRLVAYVVCQSQSGFCGDSLRKFVSERLPQFMVPSVFEPLKELPMTPSGKVDRGALPKLNCRACSERKPTAPRTKTERRLVELWMKMLDVSQVDPGDNFFELGGDSLLAMRAISEIQKLFRVRLTTKTFLVSSLSQIASEIDRLHAGQQADTDGDEQTKVGAAGFGRLARWFKDKRSGGPIEVVGNGA